MKQGGIFCSLALSISLYAYFSLLPVTGKFIFAHILAASIIGIVYAVTTNHRSRKVLKSEKRHQPIITPRLGRTESGRTAKLEIFAHYAARQLGFEDEKECPNLCKLAYDFLKKSKGCEESIYDFFSPDPDADSLYVKLMEEFDRCILSYFAFHWTQASLMINQVLNVESEQKVKLKNFVLSATRKQRFERVTKDLKVTRVFSTLVEEIKAIGGSVSSNGDDSSSAVMKPMAHNERSPVLLLMGGGMGAGKSTVLKDIIKQPFWSEAASKAVVVEADAFKETDVIYRALSSKGHHHDMLQTAELVHQSSTDAASSLLVTALNEGRDVIMDGTLSWIPFVEQTISMARHVHKCRYRMGIGYKTLDDGNVIENYWEQVGENEEVQECRRKPYRIELVGVVCDPYLAVVRGMRRAVMIGRAVRVNSQLKSHKRFASAFEGYCKIVDNARLYSTNALGAPPKLIGWKDGENNLLVDREEFKCLAMLRELNDNADSIEELYNDQNHTNEAGSIWNDTVLSPSRSIIQQELKASIMKIENAKPIKL